MLDSDGKPIVKLPPKEVGVPTSYLQRKYLRPTQIVVENLEFSPLERKIYDSLYLDAKRDFDHLNARGLVGRNYTHILAMIMK